MRVARFAMYVVCCCAQMGAQQQVAPTPEQVEGPRGENWSGYNITNSFETGYRFVSTAGNDNTYRSTENYSNGLRLLANSFTMNSKSGKAALFDSVVLTTENLGGGPYSIASLRVDKNRAYEYKMLWRTSDYFNPGLVTAGGQGQHLLNTSYTLQDHDLTLFPQSRLRLFLGYSRNDNSGAGIATALLFNPNGEFDPTGNVFPLFTNVKRVQNEYRLGGQVQWLGFTLNVIHGWQDFKDDSSDRGGAAMIQNTAGVSSTLGFFGRAQPYHGTNSYWQAAIFRDTKVLSFDGRFTRTSGDRAFLTNEVASGTNQFGAAANQQILTFGNASRPAATGNISVTLFPGSKATLTERAALYDINTDGNSAFLQFDNATGSADLLYYQHLGIRTIASQTDVLYHVQRWFDLHGRYGYSNRRINASPQFAFVTSPVSSYSQRNELHSGTFGIAVRPAQGLTISIDGEVGRASRPFTPKGDGNYTAFAGRAQYRRKSLQLAAWAQTDYNATSVSLSTYSSHTRIYAGSASWSASHWLSFDASVSKLHIDTLGGIQFFAGPQLFANHVSAYISNLYSETVGFHVAVLKRADLYLGYSRIQDVGDGRDSAIATTVGPPLAAFRSAQTFPITFETPLARLSVRIAEKVRWNLGYQYFGYTADFTRSENYGANTGYTSILWSF